MQRCENYFKLILCLNFLICANFAFGYKDLKGFLYFHYLQSAIFLVIKEKWRFYNGASIISTRGAIIINQHYVYAPQHLRF